MFDEIEVMMAEDEMSLELSSWDVHLVDSYVEGYVQQGYVVTRREEDDDDGDVIYTVYMVKA